MRRVRSLVALSAAAALFGPVQARAAHHTPSVREVHGRTAPAGAVTALSIMPSDGKAEISISISGPVSVQDFTIPSPHRIVLDLKGARLIPMARPYDRVNRGGITNIRMSQYAVDVVRIVLDLDEPREYAVQRSDDAIKVAVTTTNEFAAWHSTDSPVVAAAVDTPAPKAQTNVSLGAVEASVARAEIAAESPRVEKSAELQADVAADAKKAALLFGQQSQQARITVTYQDAEIRDVLAAFAAFSGRTIVVGKSVSGQVTAEIKDQPWDVALKAILEAQGLAANEEASGIITIDSYANILEKQASEPLTTQMVSINYVSAAAMVDVVKGLLSKDCPQGAMQTAGAQQQGGGGPGMCVTRGTIAADSATNSLLVTEVASRLPDLLQYVKQLDIRTPQVALKAKIISVSRSQIEQLGVSYDLGSSATYFNQLVPRERPGQAGSTDDKEGRVTLGGDALAAVANASRRYKSGSALNLLFSTALGNFTLTSFIDALKDQSLSDVQAEPSVVTLDNREARILVGQETPVRVIDAGSAAQIGVPARANVQFKETGIILTVTPHITNNRQIRMSLTAEQSELRIVGGDLGFFIDKRNARTQLLVNDGETAVIGGLTQTQVVKNHSGIPFLSDLPLIGRLFSQSDSREEKKDLLILITPHIINEGQAVRPPDSNEK